ncbi:MAG TPA: CBS domain-containing protein [Syntrophales bacterium]|nr:CBS domain-containing protein [Syntrophales bacterium]
MIVRYWMSENPVTATEDISLMDAFELMKKNGIRRLPVLREGGLAGIITQSNILPFLKNEPITEDIKNVLRSSKVRDAMSKKLITCGLNTPLEDAGGSMREHHVGALPVLNEKGALAGIITESDVLEALAGIAKARCEGVRVYLSVPVGEKIGMISEIAGLCNDYFLELLTFLSHPLRDGKNELIMLRLKGLRTDDFIAALWKKEYKLLFVTGKVTDPGVKKAVSELDKVYR